MVLFKKLSFILILFLILIFAERCAVAGKNTGSPIKYREKYGSVEGIKYYSYKYLKALGDSARKHNNTLSYTFDPFYRITDQTKSDIAAGKIPYGGYLLINLSR